MDTVSWRILLEDLAALYHQASQGQPLALPAKTASFKHWAEQLSAHARSAPAEQESAYWRDLLNWHLIEA